ncbi:MAG TPA: ABC transporter ATP-binding protein, partial [Methanosarcina vacuolata]|nr:ABC transporter ATP-binding protein [Methanosarcina vacuolata]
QAQILNLLKYLKEEYDLTMLFISHQLELMKHMCDRVAVMYRGKIVETGKIEDIFQHPLHPYTKLLLTGDTDPEISTVDYKGTKNPVCSYYFECPLRSKACLTETPELKKASNNQLVACHHILKNVSGNTIRMENK